MRTSNPLRSSQQKNTRHPSQNKSKPIRKNKLSFITRLKPAGRSQAMVLPNKIFQLAGFKPGEELHIEVRKGILIVRPEEETDINTNLKSWDRHFKSLKSQYTDPDENFYDDFDNQPNNR